MTAWQDDAATVREALEFAALACQEEGRFAASADASHAVAALGRLTALLETQEQEMERLTNNVRHHQTRKIAYRNQLEQAEAALAALRLAHDTEAQREITEAFAALPIDVDPADTSLADAIRVLVAAHDTETTRLREGLRRLVELKDGPRDDHYRAAKDEAWDTARRLL